MNLKPHPDYVLIRLHFAEEDSGLTVPAHLRDNATDEQRNRFEILAVGDPDLFAHVGDFVLVRPDALQNLLPTSKEPAEGLIHKSAILAVELGPDLSLAS